MAHMSNMRLIFIAVAEKTKRPERGARLGLSTHPEDHFESRKRAVVEALCREGLIQKQNALGRLFRRSVTDVPVYYPQITHADRGRAQQVAGSLVMEMGSDAEASRSCYGLTEGRDNPFVLEDIRSISDLVDTVICVASLRTVRENLRAIEAGFSVGEHIVPERVRYGHAVVADVSIPGTLKWAYVPDVIKGDKARIEGRAEGRMLALAQRAFSTLDENCLPEIDIKCMVHERIINCFSPQPEG